jgi:hypothetical protein
MPRDETDSSVATHSSWPYLEPQPFRHLMIIHHSDLSRVTAVPSKYETPLIIEPPSPAKLDRRQSQTKQSTIESHKTRAIESFGATPGAGH